MKSCFSVSTFKDPPLSSHNHDGPIQVPYDFLKVKPITHGKGIVLTALKIKFIFTLINIQIFSDPDSSHWPGTALPTYIPRSGQIIRRSGPGGGQVIYRSEPGWNHIISGCVSTGGEVISWSQREGSNVVGRGETGQVCVVLSILVRQNPLECALNLNLDIVISSTKTVWIRISA